MNPALLQQRAATAGRYRTREEAVTAFYAESWRAEVARGLLREFEHPLGRTSTLDAIDHALEHALLALLHGSERTGTAIAAEETVLHAVHIDDARDHLDREPVWMRSLVEALVQRVLDRDVQAIEAERLRAAAASAEL